MSELVLGKVFALMWRDLMERGFDFVSEIDQRAAGDRLVAIGKPGLTPILDGRETAYTEASGAAYFLTNGGRDVAGGLIRFDDTRTESVGAFSARLLAIQYRMNGHGSVVSRGGPLSKKIRGKVVYFGDLFVDPRERGSLRLLQQFVTLMQISCHWKWGEYDWMYALLRQKDAGRGAVERYNFTNSEARTNTWTNPPEGRSSEETLAAMSRDEFAAQMEARLLQLTGVE